MTTRLVRMIRRALLLPVILVGPAALSQVENMSVQTSNVDALLGNFEELKQTPWDNWKLEKEEWERYEYIIENTPWSIWKNEATPYQILAIYADDLDEKRRYARLEAQLDQWRESAVIRYQNIYNDERDIVFAKVNAALKSQAPVVENIRPGNTVALFTEKGECYARCVAVVSRILKSGAHIDIYVVNATEDQEIYEWADSANIPVDRVVAKQITLNFENGQFAELSNLPVSLVELPVAYFDLNGEYVRVAL